jgi:hypothetical protein
MIKLDLILRKHPFSAANIFSTIVGTIMDISLTLEPLSQRRTQNTVFPNQPSIRSQLNHFTIKYCANRRCSEPLAVFRPFRPGVGLETCFTNRPLRDSSGVFGILCKRISPYVRITAGSKVTCTLPAADDVTCANLDHNLSFRHPSDLTISEGDGSLSPQDFPSRFAAV